MKVSVREFKSRLSHYLTEARAGQTVEVTSHRRVVARVVGVPEKSGEGIAQLLARGLAQWSGGKPGGATIQLVRSERTVADMVLDDRG